MFSECTIMISVMVITLFGLFYFFGQKKVELMASLACINAINTSDQLRLLFESDVFVRRQSKIAYALNKDGDICMGFWEKTLGKMKYLVYNFYVDKDGENLTGLVRHCINEQYAGNIAKNINKGIYASPSQTIASKMTLSNYATGTVSVDGNFFKVQLGDYNYAFERKGWVK